MALGKGRAAPGALGLIALLVAATLPMHAHAALNLDGSGDEVAHTPSSGTTKLTISSTQGHILDVGGTTVERMHQWCEAAEDADSDTARLDAYHQMRQMVSWLRAPFENPDTYDR